MRFDLTDLRLFLNVHAAGSITGGAQASHLTLASASERIRGMEAALGVPLLERRPRGVEPTPAGLSLLHHARLVLRQMERLHEELGDYGMGVKAHIRLLCNSSAAGEHLPDLLAGFLAGQGGVSVDLEECASPEIVDALRQENADIGVISDAVDAAGLQTFPFRDDPLALIVPPGHGLAERQAADFAELLELPFIGLADSALESLLAAQARRLGRSLAYRVRLRSFDSVCRMVGAGIGVAVVPLVVARRCAGATGIRPLALSDAWAARRLLVAVRDLAQLSLPAQQMVRHILAAGPAGAPAAS